MTEDIRDILTDIVQNLFISGVISNSKAIAIIDAIWS